MVIPEATRNRAHLGHRGALWLRVVSHGRAAHGSTPELWVNAIGRLADLTVRARAELPLAGHPYLGPETVNLGTLSGGTATNIVPDHAEADEVSVTSRLPAVTTDRRGRSVGRAAGARGGAGALLHRRLGARLGAARRARRDLGTRAPARMHAVDENVAVSELEHAIATFRGLVR